MPVSLSIFLVYDSDHESARSLLQARECEAPPSWFLPERSLSDEEKKAEEQVGRPKGEGSRQGQDSDQAIAFLPPSST